MKTEATKNALLKRINDFTDYRITLGELIEATGIMPSCSEIPYSVIDELEATIWQFNKGKICLPELLLELEILDLKGWHILKGDSFNMLCGCRAPSEDQEPNKSKKVLGSLLAEC